MKVPRYIDNALKRRTKILSNTMADIILRKKKPKRYLKGANNERFWG